MKKILALLMVFVMCLPLSACGAKPETLVESFCEAMKSFDYEKMETYFESTDDSLKGPLQDDESMDKETLQYFKDYFKGCASQMVYEIVSVEETEDSATVKVDFEYTDLSPMMASVMKEYISQAFVMAFSGVEDDAMYEQMLWSILKEQTETFEPLMTKDTVEFVCHKIGNEWKFTEKPNAVENILSGNITGMMESMGESSEADETNDEEYIWHDVPLGDTATLASITIRILECMETNCLISSGEMREVPSGTKFIVFRAEVENISNRTIEFNNDMPLYDSLGREYLPWEEEYWYDDTFYYANLAPNIKETGCFVYKVPEDAVGYYMAVGKTGTNELYALYGN